MTFYLIDIHSHCHVAPTMCTFIALTFLMVTTIPRGQYYCHTHFIDEEAEVYKTSEWSLLIQSLNPAYQTMVPLQKTQTAS